jgi:hypothetical protein
MSLPASSILELFIRTAAGSDFPRNSMAESDWVALERHVEIIDVILAVGFPIYLATYPLATPEAKFSEARFILIVVFGALVYMLPPLFHSNANAYYGSLLEQVFCKRDSSIGPVFGEPIP